MSEESMGQQEKYLRDTIDDLRQQVAELEKELLRLRDDREKFKVDNARMREALKPFAKAHDNHTQGSVTMHDFRMASEVLSPISEGSEKI